MFTNVCRVLFLMSHLVDFMFTEFFLFISSVASWMLYFFRSPKGAKGASSSREGVPQTVQLLCSLIRFGFFYQQHERCGAAWSSWHSTGSMLETRWSHRSSRLVVTLEHMLCIAMSSFSYPHKGIKEPGHIVIPK